MKTNQIRTLVAAILLASSSGWAAVYINETFDTDPAARGWVGINNVVSTLGLTNDFRFVPSNGAGNNVGVDTTSGEIGGQMARNFGAEASYGAPAGDPTLNGIFTASGSFDITEQAAPGSGYSQLLGYYSSSQTDPSFAGFMIAEPGASVRLFSAVRFSDGTLRLSTAEELGSFDAADETFTFTYDPTGGGGLGELTLSWTGVTATGTSPSSRTLTLSAGDKTKAITLDRFGLMSPFAVGGGLNNYVTVFADDVTYLVPEPSTILLLAVGALVLVRRR